MPAGASGMGDILSLSRKFERALRNQTGANFTLEELVALADVGTLDAIQKVKNEELVAKCRAKIPRTSSEITGSTNGGTENRRMSGKSPITTSGDGKSYIAALTAGA